MKTSGNQATKEENKHLPILSEENSLLGLSHYGWSLGLQQRLDYLQLLLAHVRERLGLSVGFMLWNGSRVPTDHPADAFAIRIADEGAVAALIRWHNLETLANLWVAGRIDLENGTLFDLVQQRPKVRTKQFIRELDQDRQHNQDDGTRTASSEVHDVENWHDRLPTNYNDAVAEVGEPKVRFCGSSISLPARSVMTSLYDPSLPMLCRCTR